jgi:hypothetical protein
MEQSLGFHQMKDTKQRSFHVKERWKSLASRTNVLLYEELQGQTMGLVTVVSQKQKG